MKNDRTSFLDIPAKQFLKDMWRDNIASPHVKNFLRTFLTMRNFHLWRKDFKG